ncbi:MULTISPECIES: macro domain-containing protein [Methylocaldum]|jgi:O-acetyl-ADP-ribose deacetylase (regulator of RNase III)|uniref:macro domain-containing protein n=1 Tax=unclassified Methylocaldum TaxID=2622260 RepID=UPI00098AB2DB|nr:MULTISPECIES: macro domain-containing protein [unclassified Methylocaldum]MBP1151919.1 O-acetyl-ADP-ribose deacetylase (regulator of RNase III) [Methylocaldum sp. RMAD-M]MDV3243115.1 macro domain-containing protein [Methylocaldum sp.]
MTKRIIHDVAIECIQGNIADQPDMEAIVNAANAALRTGGGVAGAIHRAAGPGLEEECRQFAPIRPGQAVITGAHNLPNRYVIHCLGPVYGVDEPAGELLAACYGNALHLAEQNNIRSVAFPALSTGAFGYPMEAAAHIAFRTIFDEATKLSSVEHIRFVLFHAKDLQLHARILETVSEHESKT